MPAEPEGVYLPTDDPSTYESTELAGAGWYQEGQHGGALSALIAGHIESIPTLTPMEIARLTVEIFRVVPLVPLRIETRVVREGKRIQTTEATVYGPDDTLLSMATVQRLRIAKLELPPDAEGPPLELTTPDRIEPFSGQGWGVGEPGRVLFHRHAIEVREIHGGFTTKGPGAIWLRLTKPIVAGRGITPAQRAIATADFCNGISRRVEVSDWVFMNSDLTVHLARYPAGEWVALDAESVYSPGGRGVATGSLWDLDGALGRSTQTLYLDQAT
ncbi:MAG: thioesterase family protein [Actinobacteria bacterium]|nr:thioesterase family protein [Actinomycetota bacterium]